MSIDRFKDMFLLVRVNFTSTARVALKDLSMLCPYFIFSEQVQWKIGIWNIGLRYLGSYWNTLKQVYGYCKFMKLPLFALSLFTWG